jgi:S1-C subfamily serine protease
VRTGELVFAAGRDASGIPHASFGFVGATAGAWRTWRGGQVDRLIRLDGGLYPGLAGAPVADSEGRVIGLATAAFSRLHGVVVPLATVDRIAETLLTHGRVQRGHLGVAVHAVELPAALRSALGDEARAGLLVTAVSDDGPAAQAGLMVGDILVAAGDQSVATPEALRGLLAEQAIGAPLQLTVLRGGRREALTVQVGEQRWDARC